MTDEQLSEGTYGTWDGKQWHPGPPVAMSTDEEAAAIMRGIAGIGDTEIAHGAADRMLAELLVSLGFKLTVEAYESVNKWYA